jgi:hypothetical protein
MMAVQFKQLLRKQTTHMGNSIPANRGRLSGLGDKLKAGLAALAATLGITQFTAASFGAILTAFKAAYSSYNSARSAEQAAYDVFHAKDEDIKAWLKVVRGIFIGHFGDRWNTMWAQAGFVQPSTRIPRRVQDRISLVQKVGTFLTDNPSYEVADRDMTAAKATELYTAIEAAQDSLQTKQAALKTASDALDATQAALVKAMQGLIKILSATLSPSDPRWQAFGLNIPATQSTPAAPTGLRATVMGSEILLECDAMPLATRYRFRRKITGVDDKYKLVASSTTPMAMLEGVGGGLTMEFIAQAVNGDSQSVASDPITVVTVVAAKPAGTQAAEPDAELAPLAAIAPNGNGSSHGNGNGITPALSRIS